MNENYISSDQFGFRKGRSTEDQLIFTYSEVAAWFDDGLAVDVALLDFSNAFDLVSHSILFGKLRDLEFVLFLLDGLVLFFLIVL